MLIWKDKEIKNMGETIDAFVRTQTAEECLELMRIFRAETPHADANVGYMLGYIDDADARRIRAWLGPAVTHPVFGDAWAEGNVPPTPEQAFLKGFEHGKDLK